MLINNFIFHRLSVTGDERLYQGKSAHAPRKSVSKENKKARKRLCLLTGLYVQLMEAATGFEPVNNGFADRCLSHLAMPPYYNMEWSGKRDLNPRQSRWQREALPLSYSRSSFAILQLPKNLSIKNCSFQGFSTIKDILRAKGKKPPLSQNPLKLLRRVPSLQVCSSCLLLPHQRHHRQF